MSTHQPAAAYQPMTSQAPITVTSSDGTVQHPGASVQAGVAGMAATVNHALASVAHGVGNAIGINQGTPAVIVTNHTAAHGNSTTHSHILTQQYCAKGPVNHRDMCLLATGRLLTDRSNTHLFFLVLQMLLRRTPSTD